MKHKKNAGFTLIELMVVITIIGLLAGITGVGVMGYLRQARIDTSKASMRTIRDAIKLYYMKNNRIPQSLSEMCGPPEDDPPLDREEPPLDGWNNEFQYTPKDKRNYDLVCLGADGVEGGEKDDADITLADLSKNTTDPKK